MRDDAMMKRAGIWARSPMALSVASQLKGSTRLRDLPVSVASSDSG
jgi:hypothetical protein